MKLSINWFSRSYVLHLENASTCNYYHVLVHLIDELWAYVILMVNCYLGLLWFDTYRYVEQIGLVLARGLFRVDIMVRWCYDTKSLLCGYDYNIFVAQGLFCVVMIILLMFWLKVFVVRLWWYYYYYYGTRLLRCSVWIQIHPSRVALSCFSLDGVHTNCGNLTDVDWF